MRDRLASFIFELLLFMVFLLSALFIVMIGSRVLNNIQERSTVDFYDTLALEYVNNKIHQRDKSGLIGLTEIDGVTVLEFKNKESDYVTWIYYQDGELKELLTDPMDGLGLSDGNTVMRCNNLGFKEDKATGLITVVLGDKVLDIHINSGRSYRIGVDK